MHFNTAISQLMILTNFLDKEKKISISSWGKFILILSPFAPHIAEELWEKLGHKKSLSAEKWPEYDKKLVKADTISIGIQVNGKLRDEISLPYDSEPSQKIEKQILSMDKLQKYIAGKKIIKFIHIKNKIISIVVK